MSKAIFTTPVGRLVQGSLTEPQTKDADGNALVVKSGPNAGQPRVDFYFALAIPKNPGESHWAVTPWGKLIWEAGHAAFPQAAQAPTFAWKVADGDSTIPNTKGKKNVDREGYPGHWVINFSGGYAPKLFRMEGTTPVPLDASQPQIKLGHYVQVNGTVDGNGSQQRPGVYVNHSMVCFSGFGVEIVVGPDVANAGFGGVPLPPGATAVPVGGFAPPAPPGAAIPSIPGVPAIPGAVAAPPAPPAAVFPPADWAAHPQSPGFYYKGQEVLSEAELRARVAPLPAAGSVPAAPAPAPAVGVPINPAFLAPPVASAAHVMTALAKGATYEQMIAGGWTDDALRQHGMMQ